MDYIDNYCERLAPGLWGEPLNALSNIAFFIAAWAIWRIAQRHKTIPVSIWLLIMLTVAVGTGSTLFHTYATLWAKGLDILPIFLFQICYIWLYTRQVARRNYVFTGTVVIGFVWLSHVSQQFEALLNGSLAYAPALIVLIVLGSFHYQQLTKERYLLLIAAGVFLLALGFRTVDFVICPYVVSGTHFMWHLLNGGVIYLSVRGFLLNRG